MSPESSYFGVCSTYIFSISLKFGACYVTGQWGEFRVKNATLCLHTPFRQFSVVFHCFFIIFFSFFWWSTNFRNRILTNQKPELVIRNCQWDYMFGFYVLQAYSEPYETFQTEWCSSDIYTLLNHNAAKTSEK